VNSPVLQVKIVYSPLPGQLLLLCATRQVNPHSSIAAKEISESASQLLNAFQVFAIQYLWVHH
jgi:hypothetical protein